MTDGYAAGPGHGLGRAARRRRGGRRAPGRLPPDAWDRRGLRSNGDEFTVASLPGATTSTTSSTTAGDVRAVPARDRRGIRRRRVAYRAGVALQVPDSPRVRRSPPWRRHRLRVPACWRSGRRAATRACSRKCHQACGAPTRHTGFVDPMRAEGYVTPTFDPLTDDLTTSDRPERRTTRSGPAPACCTSTAATCRWCCAGFTGRPGPGCCGLAEGGRRGALVDPGHRAGGAPVHHWHEELCPALLASGWGFVEVVHSTPSCPASLARR